VVQDGRVRPDSAIAPALELFVDVLLPADQDDVSDDDFNRLAGALCRVTGMDRALLVLYDDARRRVRAVGSHGVPLERLQGRHVGLELAPVARQALAEDRVVQVSGGEGQWVSDEFLDLVEGRSLVCVPIAASGRWIGVMLVDPGSDEPLEADQRDLLWTLGKTLALAITARAATHSRERARQLEERITLARDLHDSVVQRLFGLSLALGSAAPLEGEARARCVTELNLALGELRTALQRPLGRPSRPTGTTLAHELERLQGAHPDLRLTVEGEVAEVPEQAEALAQSVLAEAIRNARKHADGERVVVRVQRRDGTLVLEVENDAPESTPKPSAGMGLRLAALEALNLGGIVEFGRQASGTWLVRLVVNLEGGR
jgi:signal transduction histidine kinase